MRRIQVRCPVTGTSFRVDEGAFDGRPELVTDPEELAIVPDVLPSGWGAVVFYVRVPNPQAAEARATRDQAYAGVEVEVNRQIEEARAAGGAELGADAIERARREMRKEVDDTYPDEDETIVVAYRVLDLAPGAVSAVAAALQQAGIALVSPAEALALPGAARPPAPMLVPTPDAAAAPAAPATPATGAKLPEPAPAAPTPAAAGTPATGASLPTPTPATGAVLPAAATGGTAPAVAGTPATGAVLPAPAAPEAAAAPAASAPVPGEAPKTKRPPKTPATGASLS